MENNNFKQTQRSDTAQLVELLSLLHLALKNIQLYPGKHPLVKDRLSAAHQFLAKILINKKSLLFGIARNIFTYHAEPIGENSLACTSLAMILSRYEVASLHFSYGISRHTLFVFLKAAGILPEQEKSGSQLQQDLSAINLPHLDIERIDYNYFDRKDSTSAVGDKAPATALTWLSFTQKLTSGMLGLFDGRSSGPEALARAINKQAAQQPEIIVEFTTLLDQMLRQSHQEILPPTHFGGGELSRLLASLNPELRSQFIDTTLQRCDHNMQSKGPQKLLSKFSDSVVLQLLQHINSKKISISPALLNLINKLSRIHFTPDSATPAALARQKDIGKLPGPKSYRKQVGPAYHNTLKRMATSSAPSMPPPTDFPLEMHLATLDEGHINRQIVRATLILMGHSANENEYAELAEQLMEICLVLPDNAAFDILLNTTKTLQQQVAHNKSKIINSVAKRCIQQLSDPGFLDYIYTLLPELSKKDRSDALDLFRYFCPAIIDKLLGIYCSKPQLSGDDPLLAIFTDFRLETLTTIFTILPKSNTNTLHKLLGIVEHVGIQGTVRLLHPLLDHEDPDIRMKVMALLLPSHDEEAIATLISMLGSANNLIAESAIELCHTHRLVACVPALQDLLEFTCIKQSSIDRNIKLFLALGNIGDSSTLPHLEKIAFSKWPFLRKQILAMKRILFYSLKGYPSKDRVKLLQKGMTINDEEIQKICDSLLPPRLREGLTQ